MNNANVNELNNDGKSALHYAAWGGHLESARIIVEYDATIGVLISANLKILALKLQANCQNEFHFE